MHLAKQPFADFITEQKRYIPRDYHRAGLRIGLAEGMKRRFVDVADEHFYFKRIADQPVVVEDRAFTSPVSAAHGRDEVRRRIFTLSSYRTTDKTPCGRKIHGSENLS
jgi:hypothetical protein